MKSQPNPAFDKLKELLLNTPSTQNYSDQAKLVSDLRESGYTASVISAMTKQAISEIRNKDTKIELRIQPA